MHSRHWHRYFVLILVLLFAAVVVAGCGSDSTTTTSTAATGQGGTDATTAAAGDGETYELKISHIWPAGHAIETDLVQPMAKELSDMTGGKVKLTSYPGQTLLKGPEVYEGVVNGVTDMGISVYAYTAGRFPVVEAFLLPGVSWATAKSSGAALTQALTDLNPQEIQDTKILMSFATGPGHLLMKTKQVEKLADLSGTELGATAGPRGDGLKLLGATPVVLPMPEVYEAQSRGVIDGVVGPYEAMTGFKLADVTESITNTPFLYVNFFFLNMNKKKFDSMPAEYQDAITKVTKKYYDEVALGLFDRLNQEALDAAKAKNPDLPVLQLSAEEEKLWKEKLDPIWDDYQTVLDGKGLDGAAILAQVKELSDKYNAEYPAE